MDDIAWNSYQIVANRARAMCYAAQQQQFRQLTETTVGRLVTTATDQLSAMQQLKVGSTVSLSTGVFVSCITFVFAYGWILRRLTTEYII